MHTLPPRASAADVAPAPTSGIGSKPSWKWAALGLAAALGSLALGWGFVVDDALITARVSHQLATSGVHRFNPRGPAVDCVTPLGFAWLAVPFAQQSVVPAHTFYRWLGVACHLMTGLVLGARLLPSALGEPPRSSGWQARYAAIGALAVFAASLPLGAWAGAGLETPFVTLCCTLASMGARHPWPLAALAAFLRPELAPWALALCVFRANTPGTRLRAALAALAGPALAVSVRLFLYHQPAPLAVFAKPSDFEHGIGYLGGALRLLGVPLLLVGWKVWRNQHRDVVAVALAAGVHGGCIVAAGGDWMPYFRLLLPVVPGLTWAGAHVMARSAHLPNALRLTAAMGMSCLLAVTGSGAARGIATARRALQSEAGPELRKAYAVAALDVGWVGAATEAPVTDLAGITDPEIAYLPGGHTSKRLPNDLLERRQVDTLVLLVAPGITRAAALQTPWRELPFARAVEQRVARLDGADQFRTVTALQLQGSSQVYVILRRSTTRVASSPLGSNP